ncbi:MAG TPA: FecR domain-containing protein [Candidatus Angelobacter sp.]|nr:FecR domain-containing protein [Candidatus Angelobacter sp.]
MKHPENPKQELEQALASIRADQPDRDTANAAADRVWQRITQELAAPSRQIETIRSCADVRALLPQYRAGQLTAARALLVESHLHDCAACRREAENGVRERNVPLPWKQELPQVRNTGFRWMAVAAAVVLVGISGYFAQQKFFGGPAGMRARIESLQGVLFRIGAHGEQALKAGDEIVEGERARTAGGAHAMLRLRDGSLVEMNERAEFGVVMGRKDTTIQLARGNIIVQAARRSSGHLFVDAQDCRVSVTGTVFSVNAGMKGSRVSVIEGEVRVVEAGTEKVLHPGDQLTTNAGLASVPVRQEIAWSQDLDKHLALLAEFAHLSNKLETVQLPGLRYQSRILPTLPANTLLYAGIPNLGDAVQQANKLFQQELQESAVLRDWWQQAQSRKHDGPELEEIVNYVHDLGRYLGDEIVFSFSLDGNRGEPLVVAQVQHDGLKQFIEQQAARYAGSKSHIRVVDEQALSHMATQRRGEHLLVLVRPDFVAVGIDPSALKQFAFGLDHGGSGFAATPFGQRMAAQYKNGAEILFGADLAGMAAHAHPEGMQNSSHGESFERTGLSDVEYLIAERKSTGGMVQNHAVLTFKNQRRGLASWLAAPAPIGGLDFVSKDAGIAGAFIAKSPSAMLDDILSIAGASDENAKENVARGESELKIRFHQDLADTLGGEVTFALDGPILPTPSWKLIVEVRDPGRLQSTIQQLVADANEHEKDQHPPVAIDQSTANGLTFYTIHAQDATSAHELAYTFTDGYMILGPSRALLMNAITIHQSGNSLARSADFRALLPQDEHADVSGLLYQNLAPVIAPIANQLSPSQLQSLQQLAAESKPSVVCAYGEDNAIRVATSSRLFGFDLNTLALTTLMNAAQPGQRHIRKKN